MILLLAWGSGDPIAQLGRRTPGRGHPGPFVEGLELFLGEKHVITVGSLEEADAVLDIEDIRTGRIEVLIQEGRIRGNLSATCTLTDLQRGRERLLDFYLKLEDGTIEAELVARKFWQVWK